MHVYYKHIHANQTLFHRRNSTTMVTVTQAFKSWLKSGANMKISSDAAVLRLTHEGLTNYDSLLDFDTKSIERLPATCK